MSVVVSDNPFNEEAPESDEEFANDYNKQADMFTDDLQVSDCSALLRQAGVSLVCHFNRNIGMQ